MGGRDFTQVSHNHPSTMPFRTKIKELALDLGRREKKFGQGRMALNTNSEDRTEPTKLHYNRSMDQKNGMQNSARSNCIKIQYRYMAAV